MPTYHLHLRCGYRQADTTVGSESVAGAVTHALEVARELMCRRESDVRHWCIEVRDESGELLERIDFARHDQSLHHLPDDVRRLAERTAERLRHLQEVCADARRTQQASRTLVARSRAEPFLTATT